MNLEHSWLFTLMGASLIKVSYIINIANFAPGDMTQSIIITDDQICGICLCRVNSINN